MKFLLDTHVLLWLAGDFEKLSNRVQSEILDDQNDLLLSLVSIWEVQIKSQIGKINLSQSLQDLVQQQIEINQIQILPIKLEHVFGLNNLPLHHRDPFDRLLIAQSHFEEVPILSIDVAFDAYGVQRIWA
ncbi:MAG: type II toxin-antitoxin system VapC family toxin [Acaryochloris sp. CRU_2_0]|nr:type II toxin-antitoxin system VapC family toxin [Acaryochloris sp. CRU_2_0]